MSQSPQTVGSATLAMQRVREELIPKIKALCPNLAIPTMASNPDRAQDATLPKTIREHTPPCEHPIDIVAIGVSTGGPNALSEVFELLPGDLPVPIVIVQHMPPVFTKCLADRLTAKSGMTVQECTAGAILRPGEAWVAPGDYHMVVTQNGKQVELDLNQDAPENSCRPAADVLFRSVARVFGSRTLAVVLTGMGEDGLRGCDVLKECGARIFAQDEASSVVWGMPGAVVQAGLVDQVLPLNQMAPCYRTTDPNGEELGQPLVEPALG